MDTEVIVTYIVLGVLCIGIIWGFVRLIKSQQTLNDLEKHNPLVENENLKAFVYTKPKQSSNAMVINVNGYLEVKKVQDNEYYLILAKGGAEEHLFARVKNNMGYIMLLGQCFTIVFDKLIVREEIEHRGYVLTRLNMGLDGKLFSNADFNNRCNFHVMLL